MWYERNVMYSVCTCCDVSVLAMSLMGFQKKMDRGVGGLVELYSNFVWICGIFLTLQSPLRQHIFEHGFIYVATTEIPSR